jgi:hypothetical protein
VIPVPEAERPDERAFSEPATTFLPASTPGFAAATPLTGLPSVETSPPTPSAPIASKAPALFAAALLVLVVIIAAIVVYRKTHSFSTQSGRAFTPTAGTEATVPRAIPQNGPKAQSITDSGTGAGRDDQPAVIENRFLVGTYLGTIGPRDFKLFIDKVSGEDVEGYDVAGTNRRHVRGRVASKRIEATDLGGYRTVFEIILNEPGDDKWDGEFRIHLLISDIGRHGIGTWRAFNGKLEREIRITDRGHASEPDPREAGRESSFGDHRTGTFLDGFPYIDARLLRESDISGLSARELGLLRNFIYARHGRPFAAPMYRGYFSQFGWYRADPSYTDSLLNRIERENVEIVRRQERSIGAAQ